MKNIKFIILCIIIAIVLLTSPVPAQMANMDEALTVADNWITRVMLRQGHWGGYDWAQAVDIQQFTRDNRVIGYFCRVEPVGFILVSLRKELAPVKAYSDESNLNPESDEGMADLLKMKMEVILDAIEQPVSLFSNSVNSNRRNIFEIDYRPVWNELCGEALLFSKSPVADQTSDYFEQAGPLLNSSWHQRYPYNLFCPEGDTNCPDCCPENTSGICSPIVRVGCVATAAAQIMNYWKWPPYGIDCDPYYWDGDSSCPAGGSPGSGAVTLDANLTNEYDWANMCDEYKYDPNLPNLDIPYENEDGKQVTQEQINAVAELCYEIGVAIEMDYGVCGSSADILNPYGVDMNDAYADNFRYYEDCFVAGRCYLFPGEDEQSCYSPETWFEALKERIDLNRPIQYVIPGHSLVADGWKEENINSILTKQYHMNYGWGYDCNYTRDGCNTWYFLDAIHYGDPNYEYMILDIYPKQALGKKLSDDWVYLKEEFNYRYFDQDANGVNVTFEPGQNLQFLAGVKVECLGGDIEFRGEDLNETRLFSIKGTKEAEINIHNGSIILYEGGGIKLH